MKTRKIKKYLLTGFFGILPISITVAVISYLFKKIAGPAEGIVIQIFKKVGFLEPNTILVYFTSFIIMLLLIFILGMIISNIFGRRIFTYFEELFTSIPLVRNVYTTIRQILNTFNKDKNMSFQKVVRIEYPRHGIWVIGFITGTTKGKESQYYNIFIPTTPIPTSGYLLYVKKEDTYEVNISVEEAMKIIVSGGMISTDKLELE